MEYNPKQGTSVSKMTQIRKIVIIALTLSMLIIPFSGCVKSEMMGEHDEKPYEKPWWKFPGFEAVFAIIGCIFYILMLKVLPHLIQKKGGA